LLVPCAVLKLTEANRLLMSVPAAYTDGSIMATLAAIEAVEKLKVATSTAKNFIMDSL
jgi:hypothetical protein